MATTVLLTGSTGYLGSAVLRELVGEGYRVRALVRAPERLPAASGAEVVRGDLLDSGSVRAAARGADAVVHVAGLAADWAQDRTLFRRVNVDGTRHVLDAARAAGVRRVLVTSSVMVLGPTDGIDEAHEHTTRPHHPYFLPYQVTKAQALDLSRRARGRDLDVAVAFPGALYGPGPLTDGNYFSRVMHMLATGGYPALPRVAGRRWCFSHVEDVARGHRLILERGDPDGEYILGGDNVTFDAMLEVMKDGLALAALPPRVPGPLLLAGLAVLALKHAAFGSRPPFTLGGGRALLHDWAVSSRKAALRLGYAPRPFAEGFPEFVRWYARVRKGLSAPRAAAAAAH